MAHYALIDQNDIVQHVITGVDENLTQQDVDGSFIGGSSEAWESFYSSRPWFDGFYCKRTSYNGKIRKQYAGVGFTYDAVADVFIAPQPFPSWTLNNAFDWQAPKQQPEGAFWSWNESAQEWVNAEPNA